MHRYNSLYLSAVYIHLAHDPVFPRRAENCSFEILDRSHNIQLEKSSVSFGKLQPEWGFSPPLLLAHPLEMLCVLQGFVTLTFSGLPPGTSGPGLRPLPGAWLSCLYLGLLTWTLLVYLLRALHSCAIEVSPAKPWL